MKLVGNYKITKVWRKPSAKKLKSVKEGDIITIEFEVDGNGGNSPTVDVLINGEYSYSPYARYVNEVFEGGKQDYCKEAKMWVRMRPNFEFEEVTS